MKKLWIFILLGVIALGAAAQNQAYASLKDLFAHKADTLGLLKIEKRTNNQMMMTAGGDYKITSTNDALNKRIRKRCYGICSDGTLYLNCRKLRFKKFRFGTCYVAAMWVGSNLYFCAAPIGSAAKSVIPAKNYAMGAIGQAIASSSMVSDRVFYEIDSLTLKVDFVSKEKMSFLLKSHPDLLAEYLSENSEAAKVVGKYLRLLQKN
ncbi:DUF6563 family protein [Bacteroides ihuae]|uniref:DUF6563 family protein n=1 Tax=Bacteroides ihuae TaxID=1852362 RepID=UPI0008DABBE9|nr:DUF6563 family protein [Bacteroides ihuae]